MKTTSTIALILFSLSSFSQIIPTSGMVSYYPFNGNANDESTNNFNGTVIGASLTFDRFNQPNSAYNFDGIDDYIHFPHCSKAHRGLISTNLLKLGGIAVVM